MAWRDTLQDASFRGVPFELLSTTDNNTQAVVAHTVPYTNGGNLEGMGFEPQSFNFSAIFYGEDYERRLANFEIALRQSGDGELIHPIRGSLTVEVKDYNVKHLEEEVETARVDIVFIEQGIITELFAVTTPEQPVAELADIGELVLMAANEQLATELAPITNSPIFASKQRALRLDKLMLKKLQDLRKLLKSTISNIEKMVNAPYEFAAQIASLCDGLIDLRAFDADIIAAKWHSLRGQFKNILRLPNDGQSLNTAQQRDSQKLQHHLDAQVLRACFNAASQLFLSDIEEPTLTPLEIEAVCNTLRADSQALIDDLRLFNTPISQQDLAVIDSLKAAAYTAQKTGLVLLARKPPLVARAVDNATSLHLLAHDWYKDHTRALELLRLNPHINQPNFISAGEVLNAYAQ